MYIDISVLLQLSRYYQETFFTIEKGPAFGL